MGRRGVMSRTSGIWEQDHSQCLLSFSYWITKMVGGDSGFSVWFLQNFFYF